MPGACSFLIFLLKINFHCRISMPDSIFPLFVFGFGITGASIPHNNNFFINIIFFGFSDFVSILKTLEGEGCLFLYFRLIVVNHNTTNFMIYFRSLFISTDVTDLWFFCFTKFFVTFLNYFSTLFIISTSIVHFN